MNIWTHKTSKERTRYLLVNKHILFQLHAFFLRLLSHLPHLVRLNRTRVRFPSWCGSFGQVKSNRTRVRTKSRPNKRTETSLKRWSRYAFKQTLERFVGGENAIQPQTDPTAKRTAHFWTKPAAVVSCAVHYRMRKCLLTVCSFAWQVAEKLGVVRRCGESSRAVVSP